MHNAENGAGSLPRANFNKIDLDKSVIDDDAPQMLSMLASILSNGKSGKRGLSRRILIHLLVTEE